MGETAKQLTREEFNILHAAQWHPWLIVRLICSIRAWFILRRINAGAR